MECMTYVKGFAEM